MACRGVHFALTKELERELLAARGDESVLNVIQEEIEQPWDEEWLCETDKAWDAIHRCLTNGQLEIDGGTRPLNLVIFGGEQLYEGGDYYVCFVPAGLVPEVAAGLGGYERSAFDRAYDSLADTNYDGPHDDNDREYTWENLESLKGFFQKAADAGRSVVFTVDQ